MSPRLCGKCQQREVELDAILTAVREKISLMPAKLYKQLRSFALVA
jgi:hypothetical protein